jgi:polyphosphate kinase
MEKESSLILSDPSLYNNRELSLLEYNQRVLEEAQDPSNPLLERLKFLCIVASNLDAFFEVRVAGLKQQSQSNVSAPGPDGMSPGEQLAAISSRVRKMVDHTYRTWREELVPALEKNNIFFSAVTSSRTKKSNTTRSTLRNRFTRCLRRSRWTRSIRSRSC